ncbi:MAG: ankyrin repeat domain-containing protein [Alphaproteobacteria bacterium]|nr:ankyrin repeat domain-containing protein [Alphaproteobacteria bacterium]
MPDAKQQQDKERLNKELGKALATKDALLCFNKCLGIINAGADPDTPASEAGGRTTLMRAAELGRLDIVKACIEKGADINLVAEKRDRGSALSYAVNAKQVECVKFLAANGANCSHHITSLRSVPLLCTAISGGNEEIVKTLLKHGADVNAKDRNGDMALGHYASNSTIPDIYKMLIEYGADINAQGRYGITPLMRAVNRFRNKEVALLLQHGADIDAQDHRGATALITACSLREKDMVQLLLEHDARIDISDQAGFTALDEANSHIGDTADAIKDMLKVHPFKSAAKRGTIRKRKIIRPSTQNKIQSGPR